MNKCTQLLPLMQEQFDDPVNPRKVVEIAGGIFKVKSPRLSEIAQVMAGKEAANYKAIQRSPAETNSREVRLRLFREEAHFMIGDPTEIPWPQAKSTE